jgi:hypothetical protein
MTETAERIEDRLADFTRDKRILLLSLMAVIVGAMSALVAKALVWLIAIFTNLTFYQRFSFISRRLSERHCSLPIEIAEESGFSTATFLFGRSRMSVMTARLRRHEEEHNREPGWLQAFS